MNWRAEENLVKLKFSFLFASTLFRFLSLAIPDMLKHFVVYLLNQNANHSNC